MTESAKGEHPAEDPYVTLTAEQFDVIHHFGAMAEADLMFTVSVRPNTSSGSLWPIASSTLLLYSLIAVTIDHRLVDSHFVLFFNVT